MRADPGRNGRLAAWAGVLAYFVGTVAFPSLHLAFHGRSHDHIGGGIHYHFDEPRLPHVHPHPHPRDSDAVPVASLVRASPSSTEIGPQGENFHHGRGSLAHFSNALGDGTAALPLLSFAAPVSDKSRALRPDPASGASLSSQPPGRGPPNA